MVWAPDPRLRADDYARPLQYGKPTGPRNAAAFVRSTHGSSSSPSLDARITPKEIEDPE